MKTQNTKLVFKKGTISELNDEKLREVNGGTTTIVVTFVASMAFSYQVAKDKLDDQD